MNQRAVQTRIQLLACRVFIAAIAVVSLSSALFAQPAQPSVFTAAPVIQATGTVLKLPQKAPASRGNGLTFTIDTRWSQNYGYRPIQVTLTATKPFASDRTVSFKLFSGWDESMTVEQDILLPAGTPTMNATVSIPQYNHESPLYWWELKVDGFLDRDLSIKQHEAYQFMQAGYSYSSGSSFLAMTNNAGNRDVFAPNSGQFDVLSLKADDFPKRWIDYTCLDAATMSIDELQQLKAANPEAFRALRYWLRAGGQLWVNDVGSNFEKLPELSRMFDLSENVSPKVQLSDDSSLTRDADDQKAPSGWRTLDLPDYRPDQEVVTFQHRRTGGRRSEVDPDMIARLQADSDYFEAERTTEPRRRRGRFANIRNSNAWFIDQPYGVGLIRAYRRTNEITQFQRSQPVPNANVAANQDDSEGLPPSLAVALRSVGTWSSRHGTTPSSTYDDFADFLIPGMGLAPVTEFQFLITLFVVAIGPLNYWLLRRWRRLHLLVLTVPLASIMVTLALVAYALFTDGFGTTVRAHSVTTLDQRTGEAASWTRLSYYSGLAPRTGLAMPVDLAIYPIIPGWNQSSVDATIHSKRQIKWLPDKALLNRGWLRSRTPTQFLTCRANTTDMRLEFTPIRDRLRVKNDLDAEIEYLFAIDEASKTWQGESLANGATVFVNAVDHEKAESKFRQIIQQRLPQLPDALAGTSSSQSYRQRNWRNARGRSSSNPYSGVEAISTNQANTLLTDLAGLDGQPGLMMSPKSYVAIVRSNPEVVFGMSGVKEEASLHVILGQW